VLNGRTSRSASHSRTRDQLVHGATPVPDLTTSPDGAALAGVGWASQLFGDLIEHWERRNIRALENMKPEKLDKKLLMGLVEKYG
jgi:hypothetical protein